MRNPKINENEAEGGQFFKKQLNIITAKMCSKKLRQEHCQTSRAR